MSAPRLCFLCGKYILPGEKGSKEHILSDGFLSLFDLKRERMAYGKEVVEYSRLKVPAHIACNSEQGSIFEAYILDVLKTMNSCGDVLATLHRTDRSEIASRVKEALSQWIAKIHIGFVYWEAARESHLDEERQQIVKNHLDTPVMSALHRCFSFSHAFNVPSSLFYFRLPHPAAELRFDFATQHQTFVSFIRFGPHLLISATADGYLTEEWFTDHQYRLAQDFINLHGENDPLVYLAVVAEIWAVRELLPVAPQLEFAHNAITDRSRAGLLSKPMIDEAAIRALSRKIQAEQRQRFASTS